MTGEGAVTETEFVAVTDAGMHAIWDPSRFPGVIDYQTWEHALLDDENITRCVQAGELVPINIRSDGAFQFLVRVGARRQVPALTSRERHHLVVSSQPYLYLSCGDARLTGLEHICADPDPSAPTLTIPAGPHAVTIHVIDWRAEPGALDDRGEPTSGALPDFVVLITPEDATGSGNRYRTRVETFDRA
jgi:hypothetical protein